MSLVDRFDAFQRRHPVIGFPLGVIYKFFDDSGGYLAALITYYAFVSLFPLLLLLANRAPHVRPGRIRRFQAGDRPAPQPGADRDPVLAGLEACRALVQMFVKPGRATGRK